MLSLIFLAAFLASLIETFSDISQTIFKIIPTIYYEILKFEVVVA